MHSFLLCLQHTFDQQYAGGSGRQQAYVFCLPLLPLLLLLVVEIVETCLASVVVIFQSDAISIEIMALDLLSVALEWVSLVKAF